MSWSGSKRQAADFSFEGPEKAPAIFTEFGFRVEGKELRV